MAEPRPVNVTVTGAGGQIGYAVLFRIAAGNMLGDSTRVKLTLLEVPQALRQTEGTAMELDDCAFPMLRGVEVTDDPARAFDGCEIAMLIGARPRTGGMQRVDLLEANGALFAPQGRAIATHAASGVKVLVVGNPANTNALIAMCNAHGVEPEAFTAMTRLDHNRAVAQLARKTGALVSEVSRMSVWGNHSSTLYPDLFHARVGGRIAADVVHDQRWLAEEFIPSVANRGAAVIQARGSSSAASAANAAIDHMRDWLRGTREGDWVSMAVPSDGSYGVPEGLVSSFPCTCRNGRWRIVQDLRIDEFTRSRIAASVAELERERELVKRLQLI